MMPKSSLTLLLMIVGAAGQDTGLGSISGVVLDAATGAPMPKVSLSVDTGIRLVNDVLLMSRDSKRITATADAQGRYKLSELPGGQYRVSATGGQTCRDSYITRDVNLNPGQDLTGADFRLSACGMISGKVLDENKEPLPGITVFLVDSEYFMGTLRHPVKMLTQTDDRGEYVLQAEPGRVHLLVALNRVLTIDAISGAPADPALRKQVRAPTYYPESPSIDGAEPVVLRPGEHREGVDIRMRRSPSYCVEGVLKVEGVPAALPLRLVPTQPSIGMFTEGALVLPQPSGKSGPDGKIRICDLSPGDYELAVTQTSANPAAAPTLYGNRLVTITDRDLRGIEVVAQAGLPLSGSVAWDGTPPDKPPDVQARIVLRPVGTPLMSQISEARSSIPGKFSFSGLSMEQYLVQAFVPSPEIYVKERHI